MSGTLRLRGATSGYSELQAPAVAADQTFILPTTGGTLLTIDTPVEKLLLELGSASAPSLTFEGDTDTGLYSSGTNTLNLVTGGSNRLIIDSSGKVGIGTSSPVYLVDAQGGRALFTDNSSTFSVGVRNRASLAPNGNFWIGATNAISPDMVFSNNAGNERMRITDGGNVGIGTTSPTGKLAVSDGTVTGEINPYSASSTCFIGTRSNHPVSFQVNASEKMRINSSGNLGIGTSVPGGRIGLPIGENSLICQTASSPHIASNAGFIGLTISDGGGQAGVYVHNTHNGTYSSQDIRFLTAEGGISAATERMRIDSSGKVGIGTTSPGATLHITGSQEPLIVESTAANSTSIIFRVNGTVKGYVGPAGYLGGSDNDMGYRVETGYNQVFYTGAVERMRITSGGEANINAVSNGLFTATTQSFGTSSFIYRGAYGSTAGTAFSGTVSFGVYTNGNVVNANNSYGSLSDAKLKENIVDANSQWDDIKALQVRNYNFIEGQTHTQIGVVAQEVETVSPGLVTESPDRDEEGNDLGTTTKSVNYSVLYMKAVKALQEAMDRIETLEANNLSLENRIAALENN